MSIINSKIDLNTFKDNSNDCNQDKNDDNPIETCSAIKRLISSLKYYSMLNLNTNIDHQNIFCQFIGDIYQKYFDDYCHLVQKHNNLEDINKTVIKMKEFGACDILKCLFSTRHHSDNKEAKVEDETFNFYQVNNNLDQESILVQITSNHKIMNNVLLHQSDELPNDINYVRIAANESYSIPIYVNNKHKISFITVYVENSLTKELTCICNSLQMNKQFIEIKGDKNGQFIIVPTHKMNDNSVIKSDVDSLFLSWSLPNHLATAMKNQGWNDSKLWNEITKQDFIDMGFQSEHQMQFTIKNDSLNTVIKILNSWNIPIYLVPNMIENGWNNPDDWEHISDEQLKQMNFKDGHIIKFKKHIKLKHHTIF